MVKQLLLNIGKNEMNDKAYIAWRNKAHISFWNTVLPHKSTASVWR